MFLGQSMFPIPIPNKQFIDLMSDLRFCTEACLCRRDPFFSYECASGGAYEGTTLHSLRLSEVLFCRISGAAEETKRKSLVCLFFSIP